ncbi:MAG TPA: energy-coupling factor transporter transmembrane component T [Solirubrobacteraceae bacterium]|jgi:energy-coupling factor transport system permease protein|nr:energy-coupling factor transporter transmembrane component T [Solirubrobacteraceae bacterium]
MRSALFYRRQASPLHAARAGVGALWIGAVIAAALVSESPFVLAAVCAAIVLAGACAGLGRALARTLRIVLVVALPIVAINVLVSREGLTVFARLGDLGPFGQGNLTVEALVYGATIALKLASVMIATTLASLAVDPDELLRLARRLSFRSALTASLATRMVPLLAGDAQRLAEARRTRPVAPPRVKLLSAIVGSSLDRALDVAATLELRGFATAKRGSSARRAWSRHDRAFAASAAAIVVASTLARLAGLAAFDAYPEIHSAPAWQASALAVVLVAAILLPFANRRGIGL